MFNMFNIIPTETVFFDLLEQASQNLIAASDLMQELIEHPGDAEQISAELGKIEDKGDKIEQETIDKLNKTFVTPFDREDIHKMISEIDDIVDAMFSISDRLIVFNVKEVPREYKNLVSVLHRANYAAADAINSLRDKNNLARVFSDCKQIEGLQTEYRTIKREFLKSLFSDEQDVKYTLKWKDLLDVLGRAFHSVGDMTDCLHEVALKHS